MSSRRIFVCLLVLLGIALLTVPGTAEAGLFDGLRDGPEGPGDGLLDRLLDWLQELLEPQEPSFTAQEGASITGNG